MSLPTTGALIEGPQGFDQHFRAVASRRRASLRILLQFSPGTYVYFSRQTRTSGCISSIRGGTTLSTWAVEVVSIGATLLGPDASPGAPGIVLLEAASIETADTGALTKHLAVDTRVSFGLFGAELSGCHPDVLLPTGVLGREVAQRNPSPILHRLPS
jgi:hypothetical protein